MAEGNKHQDRTLRQAFLELAQEEVSNLQETLEQDADLRRQADAMYGRNRQQLAQQIHLRLRKRRRNVWRYALVAASLALIMLGTLRLARPPQDTVVLSQPTGSLGSGTPGILHTYGPSPSPSAEPVTAPPSPAISSVPTVSPTPVLSPTPTLEPTQTPAPETSREPQWAGKYLPILPETYVLVGMDAGIDDAVAVFRSAEGRQLIFTEYQRTVVPSFNEATGFSYHALADGTTALLVQMDDSRILVWDRDGQTFSIKAAEGTEQLLEYANSVALISFHDNK